MNRFYHLTNKDLIRHYRYDDSELVRELVARLEEDSLQVDIDNLEAELEDVRGESHGWQGMYETEVTDRAYERQEGEKEALKKVIEYARNEINSFY